MAPRQADRRFEVKSPLGPDKLLFRSLSAREHISQPFEYDLELLSTDPDIKLEDVLGQNLTINYHLVNEDKHRYFNGFVSEFYFEGMSGNMPRYRARLRPWLWFLTRTADCRIFQEKTVPDIIEEIFTEHGFSDFDKKLNGDHEAWTYCVQYRETDFNFVSRLMEQEGIYYYFTHEDGKHMLILADSSNAPEATAGYEEIAYFPQDDQHVRERDHLWEWRVSKEVQPGKYALQDFDFEKPRTSLESRSNRPFEHDHSDYEVYDYPGEYTDPGVGATYTTLRLEEFRSQHERVEGGGDVGGLTAGALFRLTDYPRGDQNREYLILSAQIELSSNDYESGSGNGGSECRCSISALESGTPYRPPRTTPKSIVRGPQTAIVVGPAGEEIYTDEHGRVKVQFHWDRVGANDENSSCWIRVSHPWAGKNWGMIAIPRIGQEVIVDFLEGDPDQPIITGRVYNGDAKPPYTLPDEKTKTTIKSNSSKGGGGFNEIRLEDKKGEEQVFIHAEKDLDNRVKNDTKEWVGNERHLMIEKNQFEEVKGSKHLTIVGDHKEKIGEDHDLAIKGLRKAMVDEDDYLTVKGNQATNVDRERSVWVGGDDHQKVDGMIAVEASSLYVKTSQSVVIEAGLQLTLKVGGNFVSITPAGVAIQGTMVMINSGGAAGAGQSASPTVAIEPDPPTQPTEADTAVAGQISQAPGATSPSSSEPAASRVTTFQNPQARALAEAARDGTPFCEECERARQTAAAGGR